MLEHEIFRDPAPDEPVILAVFSYRYDAHLVPGLLENIRPGVHGYVAWDDRAAASALTSEPARREALFQRARDLGADWLLLVDPDERLEAGFARCLPDLMAKGPGIVWSFTVCEMFKPDQFRTDGPWGGKERVSFLAASVARADPKDLLHAAPVDDAAGLKYRAARINLYHLRMATPARRHLRRDLYAAADPDRRFQRIGYDYLTDERGMVLEPLPADRRFLPDFVEDHGLWAPDPGALGTILPDPYEVRLFRAARSARLRGQRAAAHVLQDLAADSPEDADLPHLAALLALQGGDPAPALALTGRDEASLHLLRAQALLQQGKGGEVRPNLAALPVCPLVAALAADAGRAAASFLAPDAEWRGLAPPGAVIHEGGNIAESDLATVVIGFRGQPGLLAAVQSLLDQDHPTEIVVVNSGGGDVARALAPVADRIRLITCEPPRYVGTARNIGLAASRAPFVAFLAGDCRAHPGWVTNRLALHRAGAAMVSSAILGRPSAGLVGQAASHLHYGARHPDAATRDRSYYGLSYARPLFRRTGLFPPGLQTGEDTWLNRVALRFARPVWSAEVVTEHGEPATLADLLRDDRQRGRRRAAHAPFRGEAAADEPRANVGPMLQPRLTLARARVEADVALGPREKRAVLAMQWLAAMADLSGIVEGLGDIAAAEASQVAARECLSDDPARALTLLDIALRLDPQNPALHRAQGEARLALGDPAGAMGAFRAALALDPGDVAAARALVDLVAAQDGLRAGLAVAEELVLCAPTRARLWDLAAGQAQMAGLATWAVALGRCALASALDQPWAHRRLAQWHQAAGDPVAAAFRQMTARRLQAVADRHAESADGAPGTA